VGIKASTGNRDQTTKDGFKTKREAQASAAALSNLSIPQQSIIFLSFECEQNVSIRGYL